MQAIASGEQNAFEQLLDEYMHKVHHFVLRMTNRPADADDLVQEVFLRAWRKLHQFSGAWRFSTWLYTIAGRLAINHYRANQKRTAVSLVDDGRADESEDGPLDRLMKAEACGGLWDIAEQVLSEPQRTALWLRYGEDFPVTDIAEILGKTPVTTSVLLFRARQRIAQYLEKQDEASDKKSNASIESTSGGRLRRTPAQTTSAAASADPGEGSSL